MCSCDLGNHPSKRIDIRQTITSTHRDERGLDHPIQTSDCSFEKDTTKNYCQMVTSSTSPFDENQS